MFEVEARVADSRWVRAPMLLSASPELVPAPGDVRLDVRVSGLRVGIDTAIDFRQEYLGAPFGPMNSLVTGCVVAPNASPEISTPRVRIGVDLRAGMRSEGPQCGRNGRSFAAARLSVAAPTANGHVGVFAAGELSGRRPATSGTPSTRRQQSRIEAGAELVRVRDSVSERYAAAVFQTRDMTDNDGRPRHERGVSLYVERRTPLMTGPGQSVDSVLTGEVQVARSNESGPTTTRGLARVGLRLEY